VLKRPRGEVVLKAARTGWTASAMAASTSSTTRPARCPPRPRCSTAPRPNCRWKPRWRCAAPSRRAEAPVRALTYWRLTGGQEPGEVKQMLSEAEEVERLAEEAFERLGALVDRFLLGDAPFPARPHPGARRGAATTTIWRASPNGRMRRTRRVMAPSGTGASSTGRRRSLSRRAGEGWGESGWVCADPSVAPLTQLSPPVGGRGISQRGGCR
jgi:hypothetical protein